MVCAAARRDERRRVRLCYHAESEIRCIVIPSHEETLEMSVRGNLAVNQLLELLEARYAIRVLWALRDGYPQTFRLLQDSVGRITPNTLNTRLKELRAAGLLTHAESG